ncbi:MAG: beta-N-acetylhexosaminidase [Treponema sp.]|jgi:hexosaminidase|nr:beta-N-acetylhexosaminidase [Treponema sp.]
MKEKISVIPKPVSINYTGGFFKSNTVPQIITKNVNAKNAEEYKLVITQDQITIEAETPAGVYHGQQTFRQLVLSEYKNGELVLPCAEITDYPRFSWRGFMLDCSRYFYSVEFIKNLIDILSLHHINRFHWHLTDDQGWRLPVAEYPLLTEIGSRRVDRRYPESTYVGGFYTENDIKEIVSFASSRHIEVIPEVDLPGHTSAVLASYPGLGCTGGPYRTEDRFGIFEDVLCAGNDKILDLFAAIFDTLAKLFPSQWVHIGGDEVLFNRWQECPKCQKKLAELGLNKIPELQSWITQKLVKMLLERGKTAIGWDEILDASEKFPLPKEAVVMSWRGKAGGIKASNSGHKVIMTPNTEGCYLDHKQFDSKEEPGHLLQGVAAVYKTYSMEPIPSEVKNENTNLILGGQCNLWSEVIYAGKIAEYMIFPRICALAETVWTPKEEKDFEDFSKRLEVHRLRLDALGVNQYRGALK